jgi:UPF0271 protein
MTAIDLNCDMGESFGNYRLGLDDQVMDHITSANIACGFHAGDPQVMGHTVEMATQKGVSLGAHPGLPDLMGFGRRKMACSPEEIYHDILYQIGALNAMARAHQARLNHVKPHGALYHMVLEDRDTARAVARAVLDFDRNLCCVTLAGPKGDLMEEICQETGLRVIREAFPDRAYTAEGMLAPRGTPGAVITDPDQVARRAVKMACDRVVMSTDGQAVPLKAQTFCVHGDTPTALELVRSIGAALQNNDVSLQAMSQVDAAAKT